MQKFMQPLNTGYVTGTCKVLVILYFYFLSKSYQMKPYLAFLKRGPLDVNWSTVALKI